MGPASVAEAIWEVLVEWGINTQWLSTDSHAVTHGDVEFELEADPDSKLACWL
jgi:hypothetical protein